MSNPIYYPILLHLANQPCIVVGGGNVAARKVSGLLDAGADITIISPNLNDHLKKLVENNTVRWTSGEYKRDYLNGATLVIGATDSQEVNTQLSQDAQAAGIPVNIADDPDNCTFILPAICKKGDIQISVSTAGAAPGVAGKIRDTIDSHIGCEYEVLVSTLKNLRGRIKCLQQKTKEDFWQRVKELDIQSFRNKSNELTELVATWVDEAEDNNK